MGSPIAQSHLTLSGLERSGLRCTHALSGWTAVRYMFICL